MSLNVLLQALQKGGRFNLPQLCAATEAKDRSSMLDLLSEIKALGIPMTFESDDTVCVNKPIDLLNGQAIYLSLSQATRNKLAMPRLELVTNSTNTMAIDGILKGSKHGFAYLAEQQTAGRGRRGRQWVSPFASNISLSLVWQFNNGAAAISGLSLAVGVAVCKALQSLGISHCGLKWPNDIVVDNKKLGGILLEIQGDMAGECQVIIGVGINVALGIDAAETIDQPWIDIESIAPDNMPSRNHIVAALIEALVSMLSEYQLTGFAPLRADWHDLDVYSGCEVVVTMGQEVVFGKSKGVDVTGALLLETPEGIKTYNSGEVSLRPLI